MAPRKRGLLDLLRQQQGIAARPPQPAPPAPSRSRSSAAWRPWVLRLGLGLLWVLLLIWLIWLVWPDGSGNTEPAMETGRAAQAAPPTTAQRTPVQPTPAPAAQPVYGVLAITYLGAEHERQATAVALEMRDALQLPDVQLRKHLDGDKTWFEVFVGRQSHQSALDALVKKVRGITLPSQPGKKPFASAIVKRIPETSTP